MTSARKVVMRILVDRKIIFSLILFLATLRSYSLAFYADSAKSFAKLGQSNVFLTRYQLLTSLSASYINYHNWLGQNHDTWSFLSNIDFKHRKEFSSGWSHDYLLKTELGYLHFSDSIWIKNADRFKVALQWTEKRGKALSHSYSFYLQSQFLKSYQLMYDAEHNATEKKLKGWFLAPAVLEIAYGLNWFFWDYSRMNIAFATCRLSSKPRIPENPDGGIEADQSLFKSKRRTIKSEYGFSAQLYINKDIYPKVLMWDHQSRFFFNALNRFGMHTDISNRFTIRFLKYLQFRIDTHLLYEPDISHKLSYRQELLLGVFYERKK